MRKIAITLKIALPVVLCLLMLFSGCVTTEPIHQKIEEEKETEMTVLKVFLVGGIYIIFFGVMAVTIILLQKQP